MIQCEDSAKLQIFYKIGLYQDIKSFLLLRLDIF